MSVAPTKLFDPDQQAWFAGLSGDRNPMHMDPASARRTQAGAPVVHGMHSVLWGLDEMAKAGHYPRSISRIKVRFTKVIYVGDTVSVRITRSSETELRAQLMVLDAPVTSLAITLGPPVVAPVGEPPVESARTWPEQPLERTMEDLTSAVGSLRPAHDSAASAAAFPALAATIGPGTVSALVTLSRLVGMVSPGLHSIYSAFDVSILHDPSASDAIHYRVDMVDDRFRLVEQTVNGGGLHGTVEAFVRMPPIAQPSIAALSSVVSPREFQGHTALILGGSRGLGEVCAKIIAAGGGTPIITFAVGEAEAQMVYDEIRDWGARCAVMRYDVRQSAPEQLRDMNDRVTSAYYFATAPIFMRKSTLYSPSVYEGFHHFYIQAFHDLCIALKARDPRPLSVFYPSSVSVIDRPADMTEYTMAKAAGEILCTDMNRFMAGIQIITKRLPRILTDQTASVMPSEAANAADIMLPIVREVERTIGTD